MRLICGIGKFFSIVYNCINFSVIFICNLWRNVGLGFGVVYNTAVTLSQQWFYDKRGLAGGIVVSSLGFAGIIFTPIINYTLTNFGLKQHLLC
jgi:OFA family oxalate/formate antiporter-like MFS transporter